MLLSVGNFQVLKLCARNWGQELYTFTIPQAWSPRQLQNAQCSADTSFLPSSIPLTFESLSLGRDKCPVGNYSWKLIFHISKSICPEAKSSLWFHLSLTHLGAAYLMQPTIYTFLMRNAQHSYSGQRKTTSVSSGLSLCIFQWQKIEPNLKEKGNITLRTKLMVWVDILLSVALLPWTVLSIVGYIFILCTYICILHIYSPLC